MGELSELLRRLALDLPGLVELLRRASQSAILRGVPVTIELAAGATTATVPHGLGRAHTGALPMTATTASAWAVAPATDAKTLTFTVASAPVADSTYNLWVY